MQIWPPVPAPTDALAALACCTRRATGASPAAHREDLPPQYSQRASFCCAVDGCRKRRATPPSLRFLGRKVYLAAMVVLISALRCGLTPKRVNRLAQSVSVPRRTLERWRCWWREVFAGSAFWKGSLGALHAAGQ